MYTLYIRNADQEDIATLLLNDETGQGIIEGLQEGHEQHGWKATITETDKLSGTFEFNRPEGAAETTQFCFGTKFPDLISTAIYVHSGYLLVFEIS